MRRLILIILSGTLLLFGATHLHAEKYYGEFCWQVFNNSQEPLWQYKFGIYEKEGGHFALYGSIDYGPNGLSASHGNAIILGNTIKMTIVSTDHEDNDFVWSETVAVKLDKTTLSGTWNALSLENEDEDTEDQVISVRSRGTINLTDCP